MSDVILYADTETTGLLAKGRDAGSQDHPHICQLGAQLVSRGRIVAEMNLLVKPSGWTIPVEASAVHGITTEMCGAYGLPIKSVVTLFGRMAQRASLIVAHNFPFDQMMIWTEMIRAEAAPELAAFLACPSFCTMEGSAPILNLPATPRMVAAGIAGPKKPNLGEAYQFFTGNKFEGAHDAMADVRGCRIVHDGILAYNANLESKPMELD